MEGCKKVLLKSGNQKRKGVAMLIRQINSCMPKMIDIQRSYIMIKGQIKKT